MEVELSPDLQAQLDRLSSETGRSQNEFVQDAVASYFGELHTLRETLDSRYDDLKNGQVQLIPGDEVVAHLHAKSAARRSARS